MTAFVPSSVILCVSDAEASTTFYHEVLGHGPVKTYPEFSIFKLSSEMNLGLQTTDKIEPAAGPHVGGTELSLSNAECADVDRLHAQWKALGIPMVLESTILEFGYILMATDPDGHRLRVCTTDTSNFV